jgi:hypothetical protein
MFTRQREACALMQIRQIRGWGKAVNGVAGFARAFVRPIGKLSGMGIGMAIGAT